MNNLHLNCASPACPRKRVSTLAHIGRRLLAGMLFALLAGCAAIPLPARPAAGIKELIERGVQVKEIGPGDILVELGGECDVWDPNDDAIIKANGATLENVGEGTTFPFFAILIAPGGGAEPICAGGPRFQGKIDDDDAQLVLEFIKGDDVRTVEIRRSPLTAPTDFSVVLVAPEPAIPLYAGLEEDGRAVLHRGLTYALDFVDPDGVLAAKSTSERVAFIFHDDEFDNRKFYFGPEEWRQEPPRLRLSDAWTDDLYSGDRDGVIEVIVDKRVLLTSENPEQIDSDGLNVTFEGAADVETRLTQRVRIKNGPSMIEGDLLGACYPNGTCLDPYACVDGTCLPASDDVNEDDELEL